MGSVKAFTALLVAVLFAVAVGEEKAHRPVHHVIGRLEPGSDLGSFLSGRVFRVGDKIWFTYSAPQDSVVELQSPEEFESCDLSNPIKMYTDGVDQIPLEREGSRYFVIGNQENCNNGQKLHVDVKPSESEEAPPNPFFTPPPNPFYTPPPNPFYTPPPNPWSSPPPKPWSSPPPNPWLLPPLPYSPPEQPPPHPRPVFPPPHPKPEPEPVPDTPPGPSGSTRVTGLSFGLFVGLVLYLLGL